MENLRKFSCPFTSRRPDHPLKNKAFRDGSEKGPQIPVSQGDHLFINAVKISSPKATRIRVLNMNIASKDGVH